MEVATWLAASIKIMHNHKNHAHVFKTNIFCFVFFSWYFKKKTSTTTGTFTKKN